MGKGGVKNPEKLPTSFMDGPLAQEMKFFFNPTCTFLSPSPYCLEYLVSITLRSCSSKFFLSTAFARKYRAKLVSIQPRSNLACLHPFFEYVHSNKQNERISPSPYCLQYLVSITLRSFSAILHVSSSLLHSQERPGRNWFLFSPDLFSLLGRQK